MKYKIKKRNPSNSPMTGNVIKIRNQLFRTDVKLIISVLFLKKNKKTLDKQLKKCGEAP